MILKISFLHGRVISWRAFRDLSGTLGCILLFYIHCSHLYNNNSRVYGHFITWRVVKNHLYVLYLMVMVKNLFLWVCYEFQQPRQLHVFLVVNLQPIIMVVFNQLLKSCVTIFSLIKWWTFAIERKSNTCYFILGKSLSLLWKATWTLSLH